MVAWAYIALLTVAVPLLASRTAAALNAPDRPLPPRSTIHFNTLAMLAILLGLSIAVARKERVALFVPWTPSWIDLAAGAGFLAISLGFLSFRMHKLSADERRRLEQITMNNWRDPRQLGPYLAVCVMAGLAEEVAYRGVLTVLLTRLTDSHILAVSVACAAFGAAHAVQGRSGIIGAALFAAMFHAIVWLTGTLYTAIIVHALYDLVAGLVIARLASTSPLPPLRPTEPNPATA